MDAQSNHLRLEGYDNKVLWVLTKAVSRYPLVAPRLDIRSRESVRRQVHAFQPDLVVISEVMSWSIAKPLLPATVPILYDAHNVEHALHRALADMAQGWGMERWTKAIDARRVARAEAELATRAAEVLAVSCDDAAAFEDAFPRIRARVVPSTVPLPDNAAQPALAGSEMLFVGALNYAPNVDAVVELARKIVPAVRSSVRDAHLTVVGSGAPEELRTLLGASEGVTLLEDVEDLAPFYLRARCAVIPLRSGGGTKLKAFEAMSFGLPIVATPEAVRGIRLSADEALVRNSTVELIETTLGLMRDAELAGGVGLTARKAFVERLSRQAAVDIPLREAIARATRPRTAASSHSSSSDLTRREPERPISPGSSLRERSRRALRGL
jgi:glycosyltransferase involved in cell wall biosynthesis